MYKMHSLRLPLHGSQWTNVHNVHCTCCMLGCIAISFIVVFTPCPSIYNCTYACHIKAEHMGANGAVEMGAEMGYCCFAILLGQLLSFLDHSKYFTGQNFSTSRYHKSFSFLQCFQMSKRIFCRKKNSWHISWLHSSNSVCDISYHCIFIIVYNVVAYDHLKSNACAHLKRLEYHHLEAGTGAVSGDLFLSH